MREPDLGAVSEERVGAMVAVAVRAPAAGLSFVDASSQLRAIADRCRSSGGWTGSSRLGLLSDMQTKPRPMPAAKVRHDRDARSVLGSEVVAGSLVGPGVVSVS